MKITTICAAAALAIAGMGATTVAAQDYNGHRGPDGRGGPQARGDRGPDYGNHGPRYHGDHHPRCRMVMQHHHRVRRCY